MTTQMKKRPAIELVGLSVRTTNAEEAGPDGRLPGLWSRFFAEGMAEQASVNNGHLIYALYTDYESDASGAYTVVIGHEQEETSGKPAHGLVKATIPESSFMVFKTRRGPVYEVVAETWGRIWAFFAENQSIARAYTGDYELYDGRSFNPADAEIEIYVAVKDLAAG